jgi:tRNA nucleotidyltransferase/poly(A) polymerase
MNEFKNRLNNPVFNRIVQILPEDETIYLVGGAIRDSFIHRPSYDLDFVLPGSAMKLARKVANDLGAAYFPLDTQRNVARLILEPDTRWENKGDTLRRIDFSTFQGADLDTDLQKRDFTMNAMAVDVRQPDRLIDPLGGAADLAKKRLKACSHTSIIDDPVRILRAVRFCVEFDLKILPETLQLVRQSIHLLGEVSSERVRDELFRIFQQSNPSSSIRILDTLHALDSIAPEILELKNIPQSPPHIMDAWEHTLDILVRLEDILGVIASEFNPEKTGNLTMGAAAIYLGRYRQNLKNHFEKGLNPDRTERGILILAGLYHDAGKAKAKKIDENGRSRYFEHEQIGNKLVEKRGRELKLSNHEIDRLATIIRHHMRPGFLSHDPSTLTKKAIFRYFRDTGDAGVDICILSMADILATYGPTLPQERWVKHLEVVRELLSAWWEYRTERIYPAPILKGDDLMEMLNLSPGPRLGYLLEAIAEAQATGEIHTRQEAIQLAERLLKEKEMKTG